MSLKGKDNQTASEDVLKLAPQVLYIFSQHIYLPIFIRSDLKIVGHALCIAVISALLTSIFFFKFIRWLQDVTGTTNL
jgi:hypothetical protein